MECDRMVDGIQFDDLLEINLYYQSINRHKFLIAEVHDLRRHDLHETYLHK